MLFVVHLLRYRGRVLPWREVVNRQALVGDLRVEQCYDEELRRHVPMARLLDPTTAGRVQQPPTLLEAQVIATTSSA